MTDWIQITATFDSAPADWSVYADAFDRFNCPGSIQTDDPPAISAYMVAVDGAREHAAALAAELRALGARQVTHKVVPDEDWSETWKQFFKPRRIGERFVIRPTWEEFEAAPEDRVIVLDPGQAFGTGDHPTTRLCLRLMERAGLEGKTVADVGCGSGVLSVGAALLGASEVVATDIDPLSCEIAKANAQLNGCGFAVLEGDGYDVLGGRRFDAVVSNIISAVLIRLAPQTAEHVAEGGSWIASGIIRQNWPDVRAAAERVGFEMVEMLEEDEWVGAIFRR